MAELDFVDTSKDAVAHDARPSGVLWDVVEEHLDEAAFAIARFARVSESPTLTLDDLSRYPEPSLLAHVDALVVGGAPVREHVILPALADASPDDAAKITAAALALIESGHFDELEPVLGHELPEVREATARAGHLASHAGLLPWLNQRAKAPCSDAFRAGLLALCATQRLLPHPVFDALQSPDPQLVAAAARAALWGEPAQHLPLMEYLLDHESAAVRESALLASLAWGSQKAWWACRRWALDPSQPSAMATQLFASLGTQADQQELAALRLRPELRHPILFALGFSGDASLLPALRVHLESKDPLEARLAAQSLGLIFGFAAHEEPYGLPATPRPVSDEDEDLPPPEEDDEALASLPPLSEEELEADLVPMPEEDLPAANVQAIVELCEARSPALSGGRALYGAPFSVQHTVQLLSTCPLRWRPPLALALFVRTTGSYFVDSRTLTTRQRAQLGSAPKRAPVRFSAWS